MTKDVPNQFATTYAQRLVAQGLAEEARKMADEPLSRFRTQNVPKSSENVPGDVPKLRIEPIGFGAYYCAAYRREGYPDVLLDGADGKPERFPSATAAIKAAEMALHFNSPKLEITEEDLLGAGRFHEIRAAAEAALQIEALGGVVVDGRVIPVEVRRR